MAQSWMGDACVLIIPSPSVHTLPPQESTWAGQLAPAQERGERGGRGEIGEKGEIEGIVMTVAMTETVTMEEVVVEVVEIIMAEAMVVSIIPAN